MQASGRSCHCAALSLAWAWLTTDIPVANLVEQELVQKLELVGISDFTEHRLSPFLGHCDLANLAISVLLPFYRLLACDVAALLARLYCRNMGQLEARSETGTQMPTHVHRHDPKVRSCAQGSDPATWTSQLWVWPGSWRLRGTNRLESSWPGPPVQPALHCPLSPPHPPGWASYPWLYAGRAA